MMFPCPRCDTIATSINRMPHHLAKVHSNEPRCHVVCSLPKSIGVRCFTFRTVASFRTHICRFHADVMMSMSSASSTSSICNRLWLQRTTNNQAERTLHLHDSLLSVTRMNRLKASLLLTAQFNCSDSATLSDLQLNFQAAYYAWNLQYPTSY